VCITQMLDPTDVDVQVKSKGSSRGEFERLFVDYYTFRSKASLWCSSSRGGARRDGAVSVRMPCVLWHSRCVTAGETGGISTEPSPFCRHGGCAQRRRCALLSAVFIGVCAQRAQLTGSSVVKHCMGGSSMCSNVVKHCSGGSRVHF